ncbi:glyoxalase superfamily protein [Amylibacter sp. IMCC11727]|uniref:glyoxalase superfamily protein n=1 Tax=Amylibacter sp. IMCC11727 TaxID=3039851 RepID=UPI00244DC127|nr:glyoxalase superfamily protein [Amylibacter sp. IMCC11727]WGI21102.1 glyoxalase superfamily protein [Amylibacter sp. IMCC11727]
MPLQAPIPILRIFDEARARDFYLDYLGFSVVFEHRFEPNTPIYMGISRGTCVIHLSEHNGDGTPGSRIRIPVKDVMAVHETLDPHYRYARPGLQDQPYGTREFSVTDPFGNTLIFSQDV